MADKAHTKTDEKLEEMEKRVSAIYSRARKEIQQTADEYFSRFKAQDEKKRKMVEAGKMSEAEYKKWRKNKILYGSRFKAMQEQCAQQLLKVNQTAVAYINGELPEVYALNYNALEEAVDGVGGYSFTLTDADTVRNLATTDGSLLPYKELDPKKDIPWNMQKINAETLQGILQGESIDKIAKRIQNVQAMNRDSAIRTARTIVTGAECKGRQDSYQRAQDDGIILRKYWLATYDKRAREWHREAGNTYTEDKAIEIDDFFVVDGEKMLYPGDSMHGAGGHNLYNCRCSIASKVIGFKKAQVQKANERNEKQERVRRRREEYFAKRKKTDNDAPTNRFGETINFSEKMQNEKWSGAIDLITELSKKYDTKLLDVKVGSEKSAGSVQISGSIMMLASRTKETVIHEFAHTISMENQTKFGLYDEKEFWKEIRSVQRKYKKAVKDDSRKWISSYEHSSQGADEFMAEAFTHAQMREMGFDIPNKYGDDFTYSETVLKIVKKYFGR